MPWAGKQNLPKVRLAEGAVDQSRIPEQYFSFLLKLQRYLGGARCRGGYRGEVLSCPVGPVV